MNGPRGSRSHGGFIQRSHAGAEDSGRAVPTRGRLYIGTSGWVYGHWRERFYPKGLPSRRFLEFYAQRFQTTEVNYSFYRVPRPQTFAAWAARVPETFVFAVKLNRAITHVRRLSNVAEEWRRFVDHALALGSHLGPILVQLPPSFHRADDRLRAFLTVAARPPVRLAVEFRHVSWFAEPVYGLLRDHGAAWCIADAARRPRADVVTTDFAYLRFHGRAGHGAAPCYTEAELQEEARKIAGYRRAGLDVFVYFNNDAQAHAAANASCLARLCEKSELISGPQIA